MEIWKKIEDYPKYSVSNHGRVRNDKTGKILALRSVAHGYLQIRIHNENGNRQFGVHRLVAQAFISNPDNLPVVNHKDEDKTNNDISNLEWCTQQYNVCYGNCIDKIISNMTGSKKAKPIIIDGIMFRSIKCAAAQLDLSVSGINYAVRNGKTIYKGHSISYA